MKTDLALSVAICTRDRPESLLRAVSSLAQPAAAPAATRWELLIVDNAGQDADTRRACERLADAFPVPLRVVREEQPGLSHARNRALAEARAPAVVFLDDDATCHAGFVDAHARALALPDVVATGGRILPQLPPQVHGAWRRHLERELGGPTGHYDFGAEPAEIPGPRGIFLPFGGNFGVLRDAAAALGGFRTDLGFGGALLPGEETALLTQLAGRGRILYVPGATVDHHLDASRVSLAYYRRWHRGYGRSLVRAQPRGAAHLVPALRAVLRALRRGDPYRVLRNVEQGVGRGLELAAQRRAARRATALPR